MEKFYKFLIFTGTTIMLVANIIWLIVIFNRCGINIAVATVTVRLLTYRVIELLREEKRGV